MILHFCEELITLKCLRRWRLQKAFYHKDSLESGECAGIGLQDICPLWTCLSWNGQKRGVESRPLTLADLKGIKPEYLSNMVVNRWKKSDECQEHYELFTMSPTVIERFDRDQRKEQFEGRLDPEDVKLSDAMATSAAALSSHMGKYDHSIEGLTRLHTLLGFEMGATMMSDKRSVHYEGLALNVSWFPEPEQLLSPKTTNLELFHKLPACFIPCS